MPFIAEEISWTSVKLAEVNRWEDRMLRRTLRLYRRKEEDQEQLDRCTSVG